MRFGQVLVFRDDQYRTGKKLLGLICIVIGKARAHLIAFADIDKLTARQIWVRPNEQIDACAGRFFSADKLG
ncbi:hypothetical protein VE25_10410 [Devosia geojensis]|uniref:Uncharacterized protein n=1 Tax=Devosia geojensis TaxID=443610 RepID=A0A0F5FTF6_9HYPH|nr:hypothetical protein VE25_10410 [Devosia geojensis]